MDSSRISSVAIILGPVGAALLFLILPHSYTEPSGAEVPFTYAARCTAAMAAWMATWWLTEAVPLPVTALLPVTLFPLFGVIPFKEAAQPYAHPLIFLFLGGFLVSMAVQKWQLHRRIAHILLRWSAGSPRRLVGGFMFSTALLSMWLSNTATAIMMLPIAISIVAELGGATSTDAGERFLKCLLLGIAYAAAIGGMGTLIGSPPNLFVASYFAEVIGRELDFLTWLRIGLPLVALFLPIAWWFLAVVWFRLPVATMPELKSIDMIDSVAMGLGRGARLTLVVFFAMVAAWLLRPLLSDLEIAGRTPFALLSDAGIAMLAACTLFVLPVDLAKKEFVMSWSDTVGLPWGTLLLFGGGLSLASAFTATGTDGYIGAGLAGLPRMHPILITGVVATVVIFLTELTSNTATTATLVPVLAAAASVLGVPVESIAITIALCASCAFMLPVATPPNAIVFSTGRVTVRDMASAGFVLNLVGIVLLTAAGTWLVPKVLA